MTEQQIKVAVGGLLHDIGKILYRDNDGRNHSQSGYDFLVELGIKDKEILEQVKYHHGKFLKNAPVSEQSLAYVTYIADNIASGADRREKEGSQNGFQKNIALESVFNLLNGNCEKRVYLAKTLNEKDGINYPMDGAVEYDAQFYHKVVTHIKEVIRGIDLQDEAYINSLLSALEADLSFVPSSTLRSEVADISLYDHVKITAAIGACILAYEQEKEERNWKKCLFEQADEFYTQNAFMLMGIDISGIQNFIYTTVSKGALKALRARSFYLELVMEHIVDELLEEVGVSRANLLYTGGGHAYLLLPNTDKVKDTIAYKIREINQYWLREYGISLFLAYGLSECSANALKNEPKGSYGQIFKNVSNQIAEQKSHRYDSRDILHLQKMGVPDGERECKVCHRMNKLNDEGYCEFCEQILLMSNSIFKNQFFSVVEGKPEGVHLNLSQSRYLVADTGKNLKNRMKQDMYYVRTYSKNEMYTGLHVETKLWVADYHTGETLTELAKKSMGIERIAVLRADVDNLGQAFVRGFEREGKEDYYVTLSRTATFSRKLSMFFKYHINYILEHGDFFLEDREYKQRNITVVYSGGDDVFLMGSWDDVLGFAIDFNHHLERYAQNTLHISAGYGLYHPKYPVANMARETGVLEELSKQHEGKNAITLFQEGHTYSWKVLEEKVLKEKYTVLRNFFSIREDRGKTSLYHMLDLLRNAHEKINLARYAYFLARLEPAGDAKESEKEEFQQFSKTMYEWMCREEDRRQLITAIYIYSYTIREKEEEKHGIR